MAQVSVEEYKLPRNDTICSIKCGKKIYCGTSRFIGPVFSITFRFLLSVTL